MIFFSALEILKFVFAMKKYLKKFQSFCRDTMNLGQKRRDISLEGREKFK